MLRHPDKILFFIVYTLFFSTEFTFSFALAHSALKFVNIVGIYFCFWLTGVEPLVYWCCIPSALRFKMIILTYFSAHHGHN